jgi:tetratricopeptide (TPR) repeat protein
MANSSGRVGSGAFRESLENASFSDLASGATYAVEKGSQGYRLRFARPAVDLAGERTLQWFVGSGNVGRSYLFSIGSLLFQAPVSYYSSAAKWDVSPGYQRRSVDLTRQVETACLQCHASRMQPLPGTQNQFRDPPFLEGGISCERCHGFGKTHIARMTARPRPAATAIVNPAKLDAAMRDSVCAQCHLTGAARVARASRVPYQPGNVLSDSVAVFVWSGGSTTHTSATSHYEKLAQSACKKASGDRLWCGSCHDPHNQPREADRAALYRSRCAACHEQSACKASPDLRNSNGDDCASCHMPKAQSRTVDHVAFTDHSIPRNREAAAQPGSQVPELVPFAGTTASDRDLALAYAVIAPGEPAVRQRAFALLQKAEAQNPKDLAIVSQLAHFYDRMGNEEKAMELTERIVAADPSNTAAAVNLGTYLVKRGRAREAIDVWRKALARNPALTGARLNLAVALYRAGDLAAAAASVEQAMEYDPDNEVARKLRAEIRSKGHTR